MSGIGGIIQWNGRPVPRSQIQHMMEMVSHRGPDGIWSESGGHVGLGFALLAMKKDDGQHAQPIWLPDKSKAIVADAALYNRGDLLSRLGHVSWWQGEPSDAAIILAAYERWGVELLDLLDGDFAFAIWDREREQLFAARDPFSAKPFFYFHDAIRFLFGSEVKQLLTQPAMIVEPDDDIVGEFLLRRFSRLERTFLQDIWRLKPAHYLIATEEKVVQRRWWAPDPKKEIWYDDTQEYYDQFRELLKAAVAKRLNTDFTVMAELSGGFDSSSIVVLADEIYRQNSRSLPPLETLSFQFPSDTTDETFYIKTVLDRVDFSSNGFNAPDRRFSIDEYMEETWRQDSPFFTRSVAFAQRTAQVMSKSGARILLSGMGGDELAVSNYELSDLARRGRFLALAHLARIYSGDSDSEFMGYIYQAIKSTVPEAIGRRYRKLKGTATYTNPNWITAAFAAQLEQNLPETTSGLQVFRSYVQNIVMDGFSRPLLHWMTESIEHQECWDDYETRYPFCDRPLVEFVLAMPIEQRLEGEAWRYLQRRGLSEQLPPEILRRESKADFLPYYKRVLSKELPQLESFLFSSKWFCEPYISRESAESLLQSQPLLDADSDIDHYFLLSGIVSLEMWLRGLSRYGKSVYGADRKTMALS